MQLTTNDTPQPSFEVYLPMDRRRELAGSDPVPARSFGAALFADISGFTHLTEQLSRDFGPKRGAEELTRLLKDVFGPVTDVIHQHGGSVIAFGGDSVICWFDADDGRIATAAGLELVSFVHRLREASPDGPAGSLDIKVAVASGEGRRFRVGRPEHHYADVLAGDVIRALSAETSYLQAGELAVTPEVAERLGTDSEFRTVTENGRHRYIVEEGGPILAPASETGGYSLDEKVAREWLLPVVHEHVSQGLEGLLAELRPVVTMFVAFGGIDFVTDEDAGEALNAYVTWAQDVVARYEGILLQTLIDDKGSHLYAVFGASVAHEDEARRAVMAALELVDPPPTAGRVTDVHIGVAQGTAYVGAYGGDIRMTYGVHGPDVNLAARLMQHAPPGTVYVTESIVAQPGHRSEFSPVGVTSFKGIESPIPVHRALAPTEVGTQTTARTLSEGGLIGRTEERAVLAAGLASLHASESGVILIEGPAGIGKSRLLVDFVEQAKLMGTTVIEAVAEEIEQATAFYSWRSVLRQLFGSEEVEAEEALLEFVAQDEWRAERIGLLAPMVATNVADSYLTSGMEPELRAENTQRLLSAIVREAPRPNPALVVVFDDGHWMDSASWAMAERIVREVPSLLLVVATRPLGGGADKDHPFEYDRLLDRGTTRVVKLAELPPGETLQLVCQRLGVSHLPGPAAEFIIDQAEGHPYFSEEIAFALRDAGLLIIEGGEARLAPDVHDLRDVDFPTTIQDIITGRFDRLTARQQSILKVGSVIGREFAVRAVVDVYPGEMDAVEIRENLSVLLGLDLVKSVPRSPDRYRFRHAITRDIAYGLLLFSQRRELHRAVALWLEAEHEGDHDSVAATFAYHWRNSLAADTEAADVDKALRYLGLAGRKSLRNFAHREAIGFLTDAISIADPRATGSEKGQIRPSSPIPDRTMARWEQDLAEAHLGMGRVDQSADHFERALELHGYPVGHGKAGVGAKLVTAMARQTRHRLTRIDVPVDDSEGREDLIEAATAYERLMKIYYYANDPGALLAAGIAGLNLAEKAGTSPVLARIYANMSIVAGIVPLHSLARTYGRRSREVAEQVDRVPERAWVRLATSVYGVGVGNWEATERDLAESYELYKRLGDSRQLEENLGTTGTLLTARGRFGDVYELGEELKASGAGRDDAQGELWGWLYQGTSLLRRGDFREAIGRFRNAELLLHAGVGAINVGWLYGLMAETYWRLDDRDRSRAAAASATEALYAERPSVVFALDGFTGVAEAYLGQWATGRSREAATARTAAEQAAKKLRAYSKIFPIGQPAAYRYTGRIKAQAGSLAAARKVWEKGLATATELDMPFEEGLLRLELGRSSPSRMQLEYALDLFTTAEAAHHAELTKEALRQV